MRPYMLKSGEGWKYRYGIDFTIKAGELHPGRGAAFMEYSTRKGEEPPNHTHPTEDEIGEIDRFNHSKKLVAFAGVDPSVYSSGKFTASVNRITKRGSSSLRHALYMAVRCGIRDARKMKTTDEIIPRNKRLREFYDKKRNEGKPFRVAIIACVNKLLHWIYALLKSKTNFQDQT